MNSVRLVTLNPGHFHAALVQKEMYPEVQRRVQVYAPLGADLVAHLNRLADFNQRRVDPTSWEVEVHASADPLPRMLHDRPGNVLVLSGRNRTKIDAILAGVRAGMHVLADKPWIIDEADLPKLREALDTADVRRLVAYDIMTERYEITSLLQRELVRDPELYGSQAPGSAAEPGVFMESMHYLMKQVAGVPLRRPAWFFDVNEQGEGLSDVGTHLVDLVAWILFPNQPVGAEHDVYLQSARRRPTTLTADDFRKVTGSSKFPDFLPEAAAAGRLDYFCNTEVHYTLRGVHVLLNVLWDYESKEGGGDTHLAVFRGTRAHVEVRQGKEQQFRPEVYVVPADAAALQATGKALRRRVEQLQRRWPDVGFEQESGRFRLTIPTRYRVGHEAHFGEVTRQFLDYVRDPVSLPAWEKPNMISKYAITTGGVALARRAAAG